MSEIGTSGHTRTLALTNDGDVGVVVDLAVSLARNRRLDVTEFAAAPSSRARKQAISPPQHHVGAKRANASDGSCGSTKRLLLRLKDGAQALQRGVRERMSHEVGLRHNGWKSLNYVNVDIIELDCEAGAVPVEVMQRLQAVYGDDIQEIELDGRVHIATQATPTDPYWDDQWSMERVQVEEAWSRLQDLGVPSTGVRETVVAVLDTGLDVDHPDLANMLWTNKGEIPGNGIDDDGNGYIDDVNGFNFEADTADITDENGHGTHCAGVIAAQANNGVGVAGAASQYANVKIMTLKFVGTEGGSVSDAVEAINYAVANGAAISSNSYGVEGGGSSSFQAALESAEAAGHLFVVAAGNEATDLNEARNMFPCCTLMPNNICVASTTNVDTLSSFSNYGDDFVQIAAPGSAILSTYHTVDLAIMSGTSMATPLVAGAAALVHSALDFVTALEIPGLLQSSAKSISALQNGVTSHGLLDIEELVKVAMSGAPWLVLPTAENPLAQQLQVTVDAGSSIDVTLQIGHSYLEPGDYSGGVEMTWNDDSAAVLVDYTVPAIAHFNASSLQIDFGTCVGILAGCSASLQLTNTGSISGHLQVSALPDPFFVTTMDSIEVAPASSATLTFFCADAGSGTWASTATIRTTGEAGLDGSLDDQLQAGAAFNVSLACSTVAMPVLQLDTYSGAAIMHSDGSLLHFSTAVPAEWEGNLNATNVTANLVLPSAEQACSAYSDADADGMVGNIVLVLRGGCNFHEQALYAQEAGAVGVLLYDSQATTTLDMLTIPFGEELPRIPTFLISNTEGLLLRTRAMSTSIVVFFNWKPLTVRTGTDRSGTASIHVANNGVEAFGWSATFDVSFGADNSQFYELLYPGSRNGEAPVLDLHSGLTSLLAAFADLDESAVQLTIGTTLPYFGRPSDESVVLSLNGLIYFDNQHNPDDWKAQLLSSSFGSKAFFAPFAADYVCTGSSCDIAVGVEEDANGDFAIIVQFKEVGLFQAQELGNGDESVTYEAQMWKNGTFHVIVEDWPAEIEAYDMPEVGLEGWVAGKGVSIEGMLPLASRTTPFGITYTPWLAPDWHTASRTLSAGQKTVLPLTVYGRDSRQGWAIISAEHEADTWSWQATQRVRIVHEALSFTWAASDWNLCTCEGLRTRVVTCVGSDGLMYENSFCEAEQCRDFPFGWRDAYTFTCLDHELWDWCTTDGGYGTGWAAGWGTFEAYAARGYQANTACCACGGGLQPTAIPASSEGCTAEDADDDGTCDFDDECPMDPGKTAPGICGCGVADPCPQTTGSTRSTSISSSSSTSIPSSTTTSSYSIPSSSSSTNSGSSTTSSSSSSDSTISGSTSSSYSSASRSGSTSSSASIASLTSTSATASQSTVTYSSHHLSSSYSTSLTMPGSLRGTSSTSSWTSSELFSSTSRGRSSSTTQSTTSYFGTMAPDTTTSTKRDTSAGTSLTSVTSTSSSKLTSTETFGGTSSSTTSEHGTSASTRGSMGSTTTSTFTNTSGGTGSTSSLTSTVTTLSTAQTTSSSDTHTTSTASTHTPATPHSSSSSTDASIGMDVSSERTTETMSSVSRSTTAASSSTNPEQATSSGTSFGATSESMRTSTSRSMQTPQSLSSTSTLSTSPPPLQISGALQAVVDNCTAVAHDDDFKIAVAYGIASTVLVPSSLVVVDTIVCTNGDEDERRLTQERVRAFFTISEGAGVDLEATSAELAVVNSSVMASNMALAFVEAGVATQILAVEDVTATIVEVGEIALPSTLTSSSSQTAGTTSRLSTSTSVLSTSTSTPALLVDVNKPGALDLSGVLAVLIPLLLGLAVLGCVTYRYCVPKQASQPRWRQPWRSSQDEQRPSYGSPSAWEKAREKDASARYESTPAESNEADNLAIKGCAASMFPMLERPAQVCDSGNDTAIDID